MHKATRRSASHDNMLVPHRAPNSTADTSVAHVVSRDSTCEPRYEPCIVLTLCVLTLAFRWFTFYPRPRSRIFPHVQITNSPPRELERKGLLWDYSGQAKVCQCIDAFPRVWLEQQRAYSCGITFAVALAFATRRKRSFAAVGAWRRSGADRALIRCKEVYRRAMPRCHGR
jgi:hypothetical protein